MKGRARTGGQTPNTLLDVFVTFEGTEGSGKSTALAEVGAYLIGEGHQVTLTREPGAGELGAQIRRLLLGKGDLSPESELLLFLADRANHVQTLIQPALDRGDIVLCDRYADSTLVYQGVARGLDIDFVRKGNRFATKGLVPDLTLLFDLPVEVGLARLRDPDRLDGEPLTFHQKVREGFLALARAEPARWQVLDATQAPERIATQVIDVILERASGR